jgi:hypothetical protein
LVECVRMFCANLFCDLVQLPEVARYQL